MSATVAITPWVCRLYPERDSSFYVRVQVWPTKQAFLAHVNATHVFANGKGAGRRCDGTCSRVHRTSYRHGRARRSAEVAVVNLWRGRLTMRVVTHELFHATMAWAHRVGFDFAPIMASDGVTDAEERITYVNGELNRQFMEKATRPGAPYTLLGNRVRSQ